MRRKKLDPRTPTNTVIAARQRVEAAEARQYAAKRLFAAGTPERVAANVGVCQARQKYSTVKWWYDHHIANGVPFPTFNGLNRFY